MVLVSQPKRSRLCGQATVAMALGVTLPEAIDLIGHRRGTTALELRAALAKRGLLVGPSILTRYRPLPNDALAIVRASKGKRRRWHWMLIDHGNMLDPGSGSLEGFEITSYMRIVQVKKIP